MLRRKFLQLPLALALVVTAAGPAQAVPAYAPGDVHLVTLDSSWLPAKHTIRHDNGRWDRFNSIGTDMRTVHSLASTVAGGELHLVYQVYTQHMPPIIATVVHTRHLDGTWSRDWIDFPNVSGGHAAAVVDGELHVVKQSDSGTWHRVRRHDGSWSSAVQVPVAGRSVSLANVNGVLHLMTSDGESNTVLRLTTRQGGTWSAPVETAVLPQPDGRSADANIAQVGGELHAVVRTADRGLWHAIRRSDGTWTGWGDIGGEAGVPGAADAVAITASRNTLHTAIITTDRGLFHTIRFADGTWQRFSDVKGEAGQVDPNEVTIAGER